MPCTTILVGKNATNDGSTIISRNDDGSFNAKRITVMHPEKKPRKYKSVIARLTVELPDNPMRYTQTAKNSTDFPSLTVQVLKNLRKLYRIAFNG